MLNLDIFVHFRIPMLHQSLKNLMLVDVHSDIVLKIPTIFPHG